MYLVKICGWSKEFLVMLSLLAPTRSEESEIGLVLQEEERLGNLESWSRYFWVTRVLINALFDKWTNGTIINDIYLILKIPFAKYLFHPNILVSQNILFTPLYFMPYLTSWTNWYILWEPEIYCVFHAFVLELKVLCLLFICYLFLVIK